MRRDLMTFSFFRRVLIAFAFIMAASAMRGSTAPVEETSAQFMITVSGTVHFGEQKARMTTLYYHQKKTDDGSVLALLFTDHPLAARVLDDQQKLTELARRKVFMGLYVELIEAGSIQATDLYHDDGSFSGPWSFEPKSGKQSGAAGRIGTEGDGDFFGKSFSVDVTFNTGSKATEVWSGSPFYETKPTGLKAGAAEGWMEHLGKKTKLSFATAVSETDLFGDSGERKLFLSDVAPTEEMLAAQMGPEQGMHKAGVVFLRVGLDEKNEIQSVMVPDTDGNPVNFTSSHWAIELAGNPLLELDGQVQLKESNDEESPRFEAHFHATNRKSGAAAPVTAENGKPLPKEGGEPGKAYRNFLFVLKNAKTVDDILPLRIARMAATIKEVPEEHRAGLLEFLKQEALVPYQIVGGFANDDQATLWLETKQGGEHIQGRVNIHREAGVWKLGMEAFRSRTE